MFDRIIHPLSRERFLTEYWNREFAHLPGPKDRFDEVLSWSELNTILEDGCFDVSRLVLYRDGKAIDTARYIRTDKHSRQQLKASSLVSSLGDGATLIFNGIDDHAPGVRKVARVCEEVLRASTTVNLYAGWRTQNGFNLHWDTQDTLILQVSGRKHWKVYQPTRLHPLSDNERPPKPREAPVWDAILEQGSVLYLPRGWWHVAYPLDESSMHLTVTVIPANGTQLLDWLIDELKRDPAVRANVPITASPAQRRAYADAIRSAILARWDDDAVEDFCMEWEASLPAHSQIQLPAAPTHQGAAIDGNSRIRLAANRRLRLRPLEGDLARFHANGVAWTCSQAFSTALESLASDASRPVAELCGQLPPGVEEGPFIVFLTALAMGGAVWVEPGT